MPKRKDRHSAKGIHPRCIGKPRKRAASHEAEGNPLSSPPYDTQGNGSIADGHHRYPEPPERNSNTRKLSRFSRALDSTAEKLYAPQQQRNQKPPCRSVDTARPPQAAPPLATRSESPPGIDARRAMRKPRQRKPFGKESPPGPLFEPPKRHRIIYTDTLRSKTPNHFHPPGNEAHLPTIKRRPTEVRWKPKRNAQINFKRRHVSRPTSGTTPKERPTPRLREKRIRLNSVFETNQSPPGAPPWRPNRLTH